MTLPVIISRGAAADIAEARDWYEAKQAGLGGEFLDELGKTLDRIASGPLRFPAAVQDARRALLSRFPYSTYFRVKEREIRIVAVIHQHRDPRIARQRLR